MKSFITQIVLNSQKAVILLILLSVTSIAQEKDRRNPSVGENPPPLDINSKAEELGISAEQLQGMLNSAVNNGGGDPLPEAMQERFFTGQAAGDHFGYSVSTADDVNGDGYSDIIVGAYYNDAGGSEAGRAYIYFGGPIIDNIADVTLTGAAAGDYFGNSVSTAGDVNGDGYSDVIVGAYGNDAGGNDAGRAYIYFGGSAMDNAADVILTGEATGDSFGNSVFTAGDVNGDGYTDVIVGAYYNDAGGSYAGRAYIYFGSSTMNNTADVTLTGEAAGDYFGNSVSTAGDVNGDGYSDVIVGAYFNDAGGSEAGRAYIYFGGSSMDNTADLILTSAAANDWFGASVSNADDVNGDGYSDVIVGAYGYNSGTGRAYIYFGGTSMNTVADVVLTGDNIFDWFGYSVSTAGDVNGDGYSDVIVGAPYNSPGGIQTGRGYIYFGGTSMDNVADVILTGSASGDLFGVSVSTAGDVNGDGYSDVIVGAFQNDAGGADAGRAYLYTNTLTGTDIPDEFFTGEATNDYFGASVSTAGDVNGDGFDDIIIGATQNDAGGSEAGRAYIYFGGSSMDNTADIILTGVAAGDMFGVASSTAEDVNGDGYADVIVGALWNDAGASDAGSAYIFFGGSAMNNTADVIVSGIGIGDLFGFSVSSTGDVNGDGFSDVIVGSPGASVGGQAYIYFGGSGMNNTADIILTTAAVNDWFGYSVSTAGDVNGDGYIDVIVGAYLNDAGGSNAGSAYIYFGGAGMDNIADITMTGEAAGNNFGISVAEAGDVNGDGYSDVIVGAYGYSSYTGRSYIYFGGAGMDNTADVTMTGEAAGNNFGISVAEAGDVNGDGYSDVIVGAEDFSSTGRVYIYFGGAGMNNAADITMTGKGTNNGM